MSTTWVFGQYQHGEDTYQEHLRIIDHFRGELDTAQRRIRTLEKEKAEIEARYTALHRRQFKASKKKPVPAPPEDGQAPGGEPATKKKRGAPFGHPGWTRKPPSHIDRTEQVPAPDICPHCSSDNLTPTGETTEHLQEDIVLVPRTTVTRYVHESAYCPSCRRNVTKPGSGELPGSPIGPVAKSAAVWLRYGIGISYRKLTDIFETMFGMRFVPASLIGFDRHVLAKGQPLYDDLREKIRASSVIHADETSWRNDGVGHWAWYAGNPDLAFFHIDRHRSMEAAKTVLGSSLDGTLITDRYAAYNGIAASRQYCLAHIIRRAKELGEELKLVNGNERDQRSEKFLQNTADLFSRMCAAARTVSGGSPEALRLEQGFAKELKRLTMKPLGYPRAETLRTALSGKDNRHLFTFLRIPDVPPTNNQAEQSIRSMVLHRKISFGTRSETGLRTHSVIPSLIKTAVRQGKHPARFLETLLTEDTDTAQRALYRNTC